MVPFSFENIARSAGLESSKAAPISDAARATHESFESHLRRAAAPPRDQPARRAADEDKPRESSQTRSSESPRNEPIRQDSRETTRDEADAEQTAATEAAAAAKQAEENKDDDAQRDAESDDAVVIVSTAEAPRAASHALELDSSGKANESADQAAVKKFADKSLGDEQSKLDVALTAGAEESAGETDVHSREEAKASNRVSGEAAQAAAADTRSVKASDRQDEAALGEIDEAAQVAEAAIQHDDPAPTRTTQRPHRDRTAVAANQAAQESSDAAAKLIAADVIETAVETAGDENSRQRDGRQEREKDGAQPIGKTIAADTTTTTPGTPSRFAQHLLTRTDASNARGLSITDADQARFVERVARAVQATGDRGGTLRLRLSPPELGALTLEVKVQGGTVTARVEADTPAARALLLENLPLLRERLAEHGMRVDQFDVDLADRHAGGTPDGLPQHDQQHEDRPRSKAASIKPDETAPASSNEAPTRNGNEQLNIIV